MGRASRHRAFLRSVLAALLGRSIDLITLRGTTNPRLRMNLERDARRLYAA